ncbi:hypothetical protein H920_06614 [Fukomys damarensis]|uniref:Uncharacterized protein n=1 Tax=Fukomys damarensis TaxID=885580 RepID=A0A091DP27_FUKDA|nr:hypothetical protein H920_06614 [Fukomys damarensis]
MIDDNPTESQPQRKRGVAPHRGPTQSLVRKGDGEDAERRSWLLYHEPFRDEDCGPVEEGALQSHPLGLLDRRTWPRSNPRATPGCKWRSTGLVGCQPLEAEDIAQQSLMFTSVYEHQPKQNKFSPTSEGRQ